MVIDQNFCTISIALWIAIWMSSILWGLLAGYALQTIFAQAGFGPSNSAVQNFTGGYLLPVTFGILSGFGVDRLLPVDPCGRAFTADAPFVPLLVISLVTVAALVMFWTKAWRR